jgi:hypothetical protein
MIVIFGHHVHRSHTTRLTLSHNASVTATMLAAVRTTRGAT